MARTTKKPPPKPRATEFTNQPFRALRGLVPAPVQAPTPPKPAKPRSAVNAVAPVDDDALFLKAVAGAKPLDATRRQRVEAPTPAAEPRPIPDPDAEALAELCDLVTGNAPFDISDSDEFVEGGIVGVDPQLLGRLRRGEFSYQAHIDLHGLTRDEARADVEAFVRSAYQTGKRCVLIIHGRGLNSKDNVPVLKSALSGWLTRGALGHLVLAFSTARPCDGGAGALYVLLRRRPKKSPFVVTNGARRSG